MIYEHSKWYYGCDITEDNLYISFDEGSGEVVAEITQGSYAPTKGLNEIASSMSDAGTQDYSITMDRTTRLVTIASTSNFTLKVASATPTNNVFSLLGFTGSDRTGANIYTGNLPAFSEYKTQFRLQNYIPSNINKRSVDPTVKKTASGQVEVVRFGIEYFIECQIKYVTNKPMDGSVIRNNPTGLQDLITFMDYLTTKAEVEFMEDETQPNTFETVILESTPDDKNGTGYTLDELYSKNLPDFYETGKLVFRVVN